MKRFALLPGTKENLVHCPKCGKKRFRPYLDTASNEVLSNYGRCNREDSCGHSAFPYDVLKASNFAHPAPLARKTPPPPAPRIQTEFLGFRLMMDTYGSCPLTRWIESSFGAEALDLVHQRFALGVLEDEANPAWPWTVHWHIDEQGRIHTAKLMRYVTIKGRCRRLKKEHLGGEFVQSIQWIHKLIDNPPEPWTQTLYGLQQLHQKPRESVAIVEGYKTAIVCSIAFPDRIWLGADSIHTLTSYGEECPLLTPLRGRDIHLVPDLGKGAEVWREALSKLHKAGHRASIDTRFEKAARVRGMEDGDLEDFVFEYIYKKQTAEV